MAKHNHNIKRCTVIVRPHGKSPALRQIKVQAQYFRIVDGALIFRTYKGGDQYPETNRVFAPGYWLEVIPE